MKQLVNTLTSRVIAKIKVQSASKAGSVRRPRRETAENARKSRDGDDYATVVAGWERKKTLALSLESLSRIRSAIRGNHASATCAMKPTRRELGARLYNFVSNI